MSPDPVQVIVLRSAAELGRYAAAELVRLAQTAVAERGRFVLALSGGATPQGLYERLAQPPHAADMPWGQTHVFWVDERHADPDAPGSNYHQVWEALLRHVPIPVENVWRIRGELPPAIAAVDYAAQLRRFAPETGLPAFDLVLLGMGIDGHTGSLFPDSPLVADRPTQAVTADDDGRPTQRVTLTPLAINAARHIWVLVTGAAKAEMVYTVLVGEPSPLRYPIVRIRPRHGETVWLLDEPAAALLGAV